MDRLEAMSMFLAAIDKGSLSAAARELQVPTPTLSRKVADLEARLGAQLLTRTTRKLTLTDAGIAYAAAARRILEQVHEAEREAAGEFTAPRGELVLTAPRLFGREHILPLVAEFLELFPEINVRLALGDRNISLADENVDMAVRIGRLPDSAMIATRVGVMRAVTCVSPKLLEIHGAPATPDDLTRAPCISTLGPMLASGWRFRDPATGGAMETPITPRLAAPADAALEAALRGVGFAHLLHYQVFEAVRLGRLRLVLEAYEPEPVPVHLVHAPRGQLPLKIRRFLDFAAPRLRRTLAELDAAD